MNREDIILMAHKAWDRDEDLWLTREQYFLERFAALVAAAEREACAKVCEDMSGPIEIFNPKYVHYIDCAAAIRARGKE